MKPRIPDVIKRFAEYYQKTNSMWGSLHIVVEELNVADKHVQFCKKWATEHNDPEGAELADILLKMSKSQRSRIHRKVDEFNANLNIN